MTDERADHFYVDQDGYGEPCIWYGKGADDLSSNDRLILRKYNLDREGIELWPMVSSALLAPFAAPRMAGHRLTVESGLSGCRGECSCGEWTHVAHKAGPETVTRLWDAEHLTSLQLEQTEPEPGVSL